MEEPGEYKYELPPEVKENVDLLVSIDQETVGKIVHCAFIAGMQLAMRICRTRANQIGAMGMSIKQYEALTCASLIRNVQVEIGAGRIPRPQFTKEELDEMDRIS
jgi:hypothetical protein